MAMGRTILATTMAAMLAACGGGGSSSGGNTSNAGGGGGGAPTGGTCTLASRQDWALSQIKEWYLFPSLTDTSVNKGSFNSVQSYIDAVVAPARARNRDRYFTYLTSIQEENELINSGSNAGFGVRLAYDTFANRVFVLEAFESAPAYAQDIDRGTELVAIDGVTISSLLVSGGPAAVSDALGPSDPGVSRSLEIRQPDGTQATVTLTKTEYSLDPISDRYGVKIFDNGGTPVGYINLRTFIIDDAKRQLRSAFQRFRTQGVQQVILDFRYNGGGLVSVAELLGDLLAREKSGQVFSETLFRSTKSENNDIYRFQSETQAISALKIAVIGTGGTASASELVANAFIPYLGNNLALVGSDTYGKPVGQIALDRSACDDRLRLVAFRTVNANGGGGYYDGLASVMPRTCAAPDEFTAPLGDPSEASISTALDFLAGRSCNAIGEVGKGVAARARGPEREFLRPDLPTAAQFEIPGLF